MKAKRDGWLLIVTQNVQWWAKGAPKVLSYILGMPKLNSCGNLIILDSVIDERKGFNGRCRKKMERTLRQDNGWKQKEMEDN